MNFNSLNQGITIGLKWTQILKIWEYHLANINERSRVSGHKMDQLKFNLYLHLVASEMLQSSYSHLFRFQQHKFQSVSILRK